MNRKRVFGTSYGAGEPGRVYVDLSHEMVLDAGAGPAAERRVDNGDVPRCGADFLHAVQAGWGAGRPATCLHVPATQYPDGYDLTMLDLAQVTEVPVTILDVEGPELSEKRCAAADVWGRAVLVRTQWSRFWGTTHYQNGAHPHLSQGAARYLASAGAAVVGIDSLSVDSGTNADLDCHAEFLGAGIPVVERLTNLSLVPDQGARFTAIPAKVSRLGTWPVRAIVTWNRWI